jgi:hypothetical protein
MKKDIRTLAMEARVLFFHFSGLFRAIFGQYLTTPFL